MSQTLRRPVPPAAAVAIAIAIAILLCLVTPASAAPGGAASGMPSTAPSTAPQPDGTPSVDASQSSTTPESTGASPLPTEEPAATSAEDADATDTSATDVPVPASAPAPVTETAAPNAVATGLAVSAAAAPTTFAWTGEWGDGSVEYTFSVVNDTGAELSSVALAFTWHFAADLRIRSVTSSVDDGVQPPSNPTTHTVGGWETRFSTETAGSVAAGATVTWQLRVDYQVDAVAPVKNPTAALAATFTGSSGPHVGTAEVVADGPILHDPYGVIVGTYPSDNHDDLAWVTGTAYDPDTFWTGAPNVTVAIFVDGNWGGAVTSSRMGSDYLQFNARLDIPGPGMHEFCIYVFNVGQGTDRLAHCRHIQVGPFDPQGKNLVVAPVRGDSEISVTGHLSDQSLRYSPPIGAWIFDNGVLVGGTIANKYVSGGNLEYIYQPSKLGKHEVCVYALNVGSGSNQWLTCQTVNITGAPTDHDPQGDISAGKAGPGKAVVNAWTFDADALTTSLNAVLFVDGQIQGLYKAGGPSPYLWPYGVPGNHSFGTYVPTGPGTHQICLYAQNAEGTPGYAKLLKCVSVTV
ncbi:hypothetical protein [Cumulibacter manganitolerans]|uniref:hypothetical protein n=1 Tax=Cumulibacter manganitolerans TaxID=1884992 RepID=UPI0012955BE0|nr:hypothetical protein [Cumulibacter manganitolerans]